MCFNILLSMMIQYIPAAHSSQNEAKILHNDTPVQQININHTEKEILSLSTNFSDIQSFQWQILFNDNVEQWVGIFDKKEERCEISYAVIKNMLDNSDSAYIRCKIFTSTSEVISNPVCITVSFDKIPENKETDDKVLLSDMHIVNNKGESITDDLSNNDNKSIDNNMDKESVSDENLNTIKEDSSDNGSVIEDKSEESNIDNPVIPGDEEANNDIIDSQINNNIKNKEETNTSSETLSNTFLDSHAEPNATIPAKSESRKNQFDVTTNTTGLLSNNISLLSNKDSKEYVSVTIKYLDYSGFETGTEAAIYSPYVATIEKGSSFVQSVVSPTFLGFAPYYDSNTNDNDVSVNEDASVIQFNYSQVTEDIIINVYYKPIKVNFAVRYFFQNINDDLYTENAALYHTDKAETGTIISDEYLLEHAGDTTGFESMYHIPTSVAADGSTVFECYYDRNYYLIQFDLDGGYGIEPIYARYGTPFVVNTPVKHGYQFKGWDKIEDSDGDGVNDKGDGIIDELPNTIPSEGQTYKALWETVNTSYTVVYWKENAENNDYSYWGNAKKEAVSSSFVDATDTAASDNMPDAQYFTFNKALSDKNVLIEGDGTTVINVYYTRNFYEITFKATGRCTIPEGHNHNEDCYDKICHIHNENCKRNLICTINEHKQHSNQCLICDFTEHKEHNSSCCNLKEYQHTVSCWENVGSQISKPTSAPSDPEDGQIYRRYTNRKYYYYIHIKGQWYDYNSTANNNAVLNPVCEKKEHSHGDGNCSCNIDLHAHGEKCYSDNLHWHDDDCYLYSCKDSDHTHSDVCTRLKCGISENHTHSSNCNNSSKTNTVKTVYRKYQQSLEDLWPVKDENGIVYDSGQRWSPSNSSYYDQVLVFLSAMPPDDFTLTLNTSSASTKTMNYYLQVLPGEDYDKVYNGNYYKLDNIIKANYNYITKAEDFFDIKGFDQYGSNPAFSNNQINSDTVDFYYNRITDHYLQFDNNGLQVKENEVYGIMYGESVNEYYFTPKYPENLEPNAYSFEGWYTSAGCFDGTDVNWDTITMPEGNLLLYAKWVPNTHKVNFFTTYDDMVAFEDGDNSVTAHSSYPAVTHGTTIGSIESPVFNSNNNMSLIFAGWFYIENGEKKAFSPLDMPINRDMNIFADWSSNQPQPFSIEYVLKNNPEIKVADDMKGFAYGGSTRTFTAKAGKPYNQLYDEYNSGYFPTVGSHSITMEYEEDKENPVNNVYSFYYVQANNIEYTVRYVNKETNTLLEEAQVKYTGDSVVTERFKAFTNMVPDAFYKRLVISVEWDEDKGKYVGTDNNIITFYYTPNDDSAYYAVHHMLEKLPDPNLSAEENETRKSQYYIDGSGGYESTGTHIEGIGNIDKTVPINPQVFNGFKLIENAAISVIEGNESSAAYVNGNYNIKVTSKGTELYIFYERLDFDYTVHFYEYNTTNSLANSINSNAPYGSLVKSTAIDIAGYTCVSSSPTQTLKIQDDSKQNEIIFYYAPSQYVVDYIAVTSDEGMLDQTKEVTTGAQDFKGSTPTPKSFCEFVGWYLDQECTLPVTDEFGSIDKGSNKFVPNKNALSSSEQNVFYAKFIRKAGNLTIKRESVVDPSQVFVYEVRNNETGEVINVTVTGNNSVTINDLAFGEYTITQQNDWSWRYSDAQQTAVKHNNSSGTFVEFNKGCDTEQWLNGNSNIAINRRGG